MTLGAKAPHSRGDLSPMTEKTQKSKVVVLVKHMHTHTHAHTRLLHFSGYPPIRRTRPFLHIYQPLQLAQQPARTHARTRTPGQSFGKPVPEQIWKRVSRNHFLKSWNPIPIARYAKTKKQNPKTKPKKGFKNNVIHVHDRQPVRHHQSHFDDHYRFHCASRRGNLMRGCRAGWDLPT